MSAEIKYSYRLLLPLTAYSLIPSFMNVIVHKTDCHFSVVIVLSSEIKWNSFTESSHNSVEYKESYETFMSRHIFYNKSLHDKGEIISCAFKLQIKWNRKPFA